ncbi:hypothetical protein [Streptomyces noursei]|uniref:hypothetical protein n=1 Tax=Streptomyces noursei TaxID=1971 RepID=UPI0016770461|nr:hypothetical protein [Streptomyces noursei]MCZ1013004.1 hypothetical protein [Streptomyces noursei]
MTPSPRARVVLDGSEGLEVKCNLDVECHALSVSRADDESGVEVGAVSQHCDTLALLGQAGSPQRKCRLTTFWNTLQLVLYGLSRFR